MDKDGPERQRNAIKKFCDAHKLTLSGTASENISGTVDGLDRPEFRDLLAKIHHLRRNGIEVEAIVVERMDRFARDLMVSEVLLAQCRKHNLKIFSADQEALIDMAADDGDPTRVLIRQIMAALAQWDKTNIVRRLRAARERKKAETGWCGGTRPFGARDGEEELLKYLKHLCQQEPRMTLRKMEQHMAEIGLRNRRGDPWTYASLGFIIKNHVEGK